MAIRQLRMKGFRNLGELEVTFAPEMNYLFGPNGAGKTNLLEAVHYLAIGRSFRRVPDRDLLEFGRGFMSVGGSDESGVEAEIRLDNSEKRVLLDGKRIDRLSEYLGWLPVVALLLEDIELVRGAPSLRRGFLDLALAKADRSHIGFVADYRRALLQRNRLLEQRARAEVQSVWDEELVRAGVRLMGFRQKHVHRLLETAGRHCEAMGGRDVVFEFRPSVASDGDLAAAFHARLAATRSRELEVGYTLVGPHRDDIRIRCAGVDLFRYGSVGEQRLAAIALRLAEADLLLGVREERPVFLLDEVASELDEGRSSRMLALVRSKGQMVYAAVRRFEIEGKEFHVEAGQVAEIPKRG